MTKLQINITKEVLENSALCGIVSDKTDETVGTNCAIALAVRNIFPLAYVSHAAIFESYECAMKNEYSAISQLPDNAREFISFFDRATSVERVQMQPFSFEIEIPDSVIEKMEFPQLEELKKQTSQFQLA